MIELINVGNKTNNVHNHLYLILVKNNKPIPTIGKLLAKKEKNFALADEIRNELNEIGIVLEDSKEKTT